MQVAECLIDTGDFHSALTALSDVSARYCIFLTYDTSHIKSKEWPNLS